LPDELKVKGHLTPSLAGKIATMANVKKLMLIHFYPECDEVDIEKQCRKTYSNKLILAEDFMKINFESAGRELSPLKLLINRERRET
ncbi:MAG: hypothetical protein K8R12_06930, partial [Desulfobacterales bacterium]|nr:hypothetical protein [Desulfobacterales bacterium]